MSHDPLSGTPPATATPRSGAAVVSAYGAFRLVLLLLAGWSAFAGFALVTGFGALSYDSGVASNVAGAQLLVLAGIYAIIAWRRDEYRMLLWVPYAGQLAIVLPGLWQLVFDQATDAPLLLVVSILFLALLVYLWFSSHPADFFREDDDPGDEALEGELLDEAEEPEDGAPPADAQSRGRRYRRST